MFIAFDVGETLIQYEGLALDWSEHYRPALEQALSACSVAADDASLAVAVEILAFYNTRKNPRTFEIQSGEVTSKISRLFDTSHADFERFFFAYFQRRARSNTGAQQLVTQLRAAGFHVAALSDVPYGMPTAMLIEDLGDLASAFHQIASSCDVGFRKPSGEGLCKLLRLSGCGAGKAYYVGNEKKDIEAAIAAKMHGILLSTDSLPPDYGQTYTVRSLHEVFGIVL